MIPPLVSASWVGERLDAVTVADVRWYPDGRDTAAAFCAAHLPGAVFVDLDAALSAAPGPHGRHPLPSPEEFAAAMAARGIGHADTVVCYDDVGGVVAARLVWMLRVTGHEATLLDGGLGGWPGRREVGPPCDRPPAEFFPAPWPSERLASAGDAADRSETVVDARDRSRYRGEAHPLDVLAGHIPGALNSPTRETLDDRGFVRPSVELRRRFVEAGLSPGTDPVVYCGSGVTACHLLLMLEYAGLGPGRLYPGSWSEWCGMRDAEVATGPEPG